MRSVVGGCDLARVVGSVGWLLLLVCVGAEDLPRCGYFELCGGLLVVLLNLSVFTPGGPLPFVAWAVRFLRRRLLCGGGRAGGGARLQ